MRGAMSTSTSALIGGASARPTAAMLMRPPSEAPTTASGVPSSRQMRSMVSANTSIR